jgi:subtilisin-like proprotein convertase family protein
LSGLSVWWYEITNDHQEVLLMRSIILAGVLLLFPIQAHATSYTLELETPFRFDASNTPATFQLFVGDVGALTSLGVEFDLVHEFFRDVRTVLVSPTGVPALLTPQYVFDPESSTPGSDRDRPLPFETTAFNGTVAFGVWTLVLLDLFLGDSGVFRGFTLTPEVDGGLAPVPEPATLFLVAGGGAAASWVRRRAKKNESHG